MSEERSTDIDINSAFDALVDRTAFKLDDKSWNAELAAPPKDNPQLGKLLARKPARKV
jgi:uncharacterized protein (DUF1778 family)